MAAAGSNTSGTFDFAPTLGDVFINAYGRCQIRRTAITPDHLRDAAMSANLVQVEWSNEQVNLWTVDLQSIPLITGQDTYDVDPSTIMIMAAWIQTTYPPDGRPKDRMLTSIDRDTYAAFPDKTKPGDPTVYWYQKLIEPKITLWEPPDDKEDRILKFYRARQMQDAVFPKGLQPEVPYTFLEAYIAALAFKLAELYAPARMEELAARAANTFKNAKERNVENAPLKIVPALSTYTSAVY